MSSKGLVLQKHLQCYNAAAFGKQKRTLTNLVEPFSLTHLHLMRLYIHVPT